MISCNRHLAVLAVGRKRLLLWPACIALTCSTFSRDVGAQIAALHGHSQPTGVQAWSCSVAGQL